MDTIDRLLSKTDDVIIARGRNYFKEGRVCALEQAGDLYLAEVEGSNYEPYHVQVSLGENGNLNHFDCDCPYDFGPVCKHLVAVFLAIKAEQMQISTPAKKSVSKQTGKVNLASLVAELKQNDLQALVLKWAGSNPVLRKELLLLAGHYDQTDEQNEVKARIRAALRKGRRDGYIGAYACDEICGELDEIIALAEERSEKYPMAALNILLEVIQAGMNLASEADTSSGFLTNILANATDTLDVLCQNLAETGSSKEKESCFQQLLALAQDNCFDGWMEEVYHILRSAIYFLNKEDSTRLTAVLVALEERKSNGVDSFSSQKNGLTQIFILEKLEGRNVARQALYRDLSFFQARELAYQWAMEERDFTEAVRLCEEGVNGKTDWQSVPWLERMNVAYCQAANRPGQEDTLARILLAGHIEAYEGLKRMLTQDGTWKEYYPVLRDKCALRLPHDLYMELLDREGESELLMSMVERTPRSVLRYGRCLAKKFPVRTFVIYKTVIEHMAQQASNRKDYQKVCRAIKDLHISGGTIEAAALIKRYTESYTRKRAFQEELHVLQMDLMTATR